MLLCRHSQRLLVVMLSGSESALLVSNAILLFARLILQQQQVFEQLLGSAAAASSGGGASDHQQQQQAGSSTPEGLLMALVGTLCEKFDTIAQPLARKLSVCALAALLGLPVEVRSSFHQHPQEAHGMFTNQLHHINHPLTAIHSSITQLPVCNLANTHTHCCCSAPLLCP